MVLCNSTNNFLNWSGVKKKKKKKIKDKNNPGQVSDIAFGWAIW